MLPPPPTLGVSPQAAAPSPQFTPPGAAEALAVLRAVGWPQEVVVLDWETYFSKDYHLKGRGEKGLSTIEYIEDQRFGEEGLAVLTIKAAMPQTPRQATFWPNVPEELAWLQSRYGRHLEACTVVYFNGRFDGAILARKHGIVPPYVVDVRDLSKHLDARNKHSLKDCCIRYGLPPKGDTMEFQGLRWATMTPAERESYAAYACNDAEREADLLCLLLPRLTRPEVELPIARHTLRLFWEPEFCFDFTEADRLAGLMEAQVAKDTEPTGATPAAISGNNSFAELLNAALAETGEALAMKKGKKKLIPALAKDDAAVEQYKRHRNPRVRELIKARQAVKSWPLHIRRVRAMGDQARAAGGRLPNPLNYYGAHTGRWSGGEGINTYNFPARGDGLQTEIKHCLTAPPGATFIMSDAAAIEARGDAWVAGQEDLLIAFRNGGDVYSDFAAEALCAPCRRAMKTDPPPVARLYTIRRAIGKEAILGLGYGMGWEKLLDRLETKPELRPKVESGEIGEFLVRQMVKTYRTKYSCIPAFWRDIEDAFRYVTKYGISRDLRSLSLSREGTTTVIRLPSGRCLFYPHAHIADEGRIAFQWGDLWGGTLTENIVQAMSRDVLAEAVLLVEEQFRVVHHVYDSIVAVAPEDRAEEAKACVEAALTRVPDWATNWPLGCETTIARRYE